MATTTSTLLRPPSLPSHTTASSSTGPSNATSNHSAQASEVNKLRIVHVANRLTRHFQSGLRLDPNELFKLCFALGRGIDYAVSHDDWAPNAHDLPTVIKKVYQYKDDNLLRAAILVLLISAKNACGKNWFCAEDSAELMTMANEMSSSFCLSNRISSESSNALEVMLKVMPRYFPMLKLNRLIASFEVKAGYEVLLADIYIPRNISPEERITLFVAQSDNIESSTCIINPSQVNFLVNGKGVERRTNVHVENGPQLPTDITKMLKYGLNLFQAAGSFSGNYIVTISVMSKINPLDTSALQDYVRAGATVDLSDAEIIEGPSRISLNCPISHKRIKVPIRGHLCKHHQCFDFDTYMEMNSKKPCWRCPHCNQSVSYTDLRIDQNMVKILAESGERVSVVIISADGSWEAAEESQNNAIQMHKQLLSGNNESNVGTEPTRVTCDQIDIMDLTTEDNCESVTLPNSKQLDSQIGHLRQGGSPEIIIDKKLLRDGNVCGTAQPTLQVSTEIYPAISTSNLLVPTRTSTHLLTAPVNTTVDGASLGLDWNRRYGARAPESVLQSAPQSGQAANNLQSQHLGSIDCIEAQRLPIPRNISRNSNAVQALPAMQNQNFGKRPRISDINTSFLNTNSSSLSHSQPALFERISNISTSGITSPTQHQSITQPFSSQSRQQVIGLHATSNPSSNQTRTGGCGGPFLQPHLDIQNPHQQHPNVHSHQMLSRLASLVRPPLQFTSRMQQTSQPSNLSAAKRASSLPMPRLMPTPRAFMTTAPPQVTVNRFRPSGGEQVQNVGGGSQQAATKSGNLPVSSADSNWRPTGRMRGSLTGGAYSAALSRYAAQTTQKISSSTSTAPGLSRQANSSSTAQTPPQNSEDETS